MNYYIQGSPARAEEIKAAFEKKGFIPRIAPIYYGSESVFFFTGIDDYIYETANPWIVEIIKTHPDYQELELPTKPNFKVGDWVVTDYGKVSQVVSVDKDGDGYTLDDGVYFSGSWCDMYHHWTISDVKDGDVLTDGKKIVIFNKFEEPTRKQRIIAYAGLDLSSKLQITEETKDSWRLAADRIMPATKEQRDLLFQKMKEAGYQWDADKKELSKIKLPNFKTGDWIITDKNHVWFVDKDCSTTGYLYRLIAPHGKVEVGEYEAVDAHSRLWTIQDAKDGDVLATDNGWTCIFKAFDGCVFSSYCFMDSQKWFCGFGSEAHTLDSRVNGNIHPATKEQRELLFKKMKEAGYQWDADKKELSKIQPHYDIANFQPFDKVLVRDGDLGLWKCDIFSDYYDNFYCFRGTWEQCIPFNEETKHLLSTSDPCDERFINW